MEKFKFFAEMCLINEHKKSLEENFEWVNQLKDK